MKSVNTNKEHLDRAYQQFVDKPSTETYLTLTASASSYVHAIERANKLSEHQIKNNIPEILHSKVWPTRQVEFEKIQNLFHTLNWSITKHFEAKDTETWTLTDPEGYKALLCLDFFGFSILGVAIGEKPKGAFKGLQQKLKFVEFLNFWGIELID